MSDDRETRPGTGRATPDEADELIERWRLASSLVRPVAAAELIRAPRRGSRRVAGRAAALGAVAVVVVAAVLGTGAWLSLRTGSAGTPRPSASPVAATTPTPAPSPTAVAPTPTPGPTPVATPSPAPTPPFGLVEHEQILQLSPAADRGWILTLFRLLVREGSGWQDCWQSPDEVQWTPDLRAVVRGRSIWVARERMLFMSTDGCATWRQAALPSSASSFTMATDSVGYLLGPEAPATQSQPQPRVPVYRTTDGGMHWAAAGTVAGDGKLAFVDADHGILAGNGGISRTTNGGRTWLAVPLVAPFGIIGRLDQVSAPVAAADGRLLVAAKYSAPPGMDGAKGEQVIYASTDGGKSWSVKGRLKDAGMLTVSLVDAWTWVAFDLAPGTSFRSTTDAGATYRTTPMSGWPAGVRLNLLSSAAFADADHGWIAASEPDPSCPGKAICDHLYPPPQHLLATSDGGATWQDILN